MVTLLTSVLSVNTSVGGGLGFVLHVPKSNVNVLAPSVAEDDENPEKDKVCPPASCETPTLWPNGVTAILPLSVISTDLSSEDATTRPVLPSSTSRFWSNVFISAFTSPRDEMETVRCSIFSFSCVSRGMRSASTMASTIWVTLRPLPTFSALR